MGRAFLEYVNFTLPNLHKNAKKGIRCTTVQISDWDLLFKKS